VYTAIFILERGFHLSSLTWRKKGFQQFCCRTRNGGGSDKMGDDFKILKPKPTSPSKTPLHHSQNDTVSTPSVSETDAENPLPELPEELIINEILLRLPVRSLLQFKCVCKSWNTLISDPQFAKTHQKASTANPLLVTSVIHSGKCEIISYPVKPPLENLSTPVESISIFGTRHEYHIIDSFNGLLCLYDVSQYNFTLWNPSINLKSETSPTNVLSDYEFMTYHGFGYDHVNDKYKVLVVMRNPAVVDHREIVTRIYTFGENSWRTVPNFPGKSHVWSGKFVSGTLNWLVYKRGCGNSNQRGILSFDLGKETFGEVLLPQHDGYDVRNCGLYVLSNCLCVCFDHSNKNHWGVWMMNQYGVTESWTKLTIIPRKKLMRHLVDPLFISENGVLILLNSIYSKFVRYNLNNGRIGYPKILGKLGREMHIYHESLVSPQW